MKANYLVISDKNESVFKKGEIITTLKGIDINEYLGFKVDLSERIYLGTRAVKIVKI